MYIWIKKPDSYNLILYILPTELSGSYYQESDFRWEFFLCLIWKHQRLNLGPSVYKENPLAYIVSRTFSLALSFPSHICMAFQPRRTIWVPLPILLLNLKWRSHFNNSWEHPLLQGCQNSPARSHSSHLRSR